MENTEKISQYKKIIEASYKCLSERGYANVSLREIASEAGVALSQLHYYFGSKKELFKAIMQKMVDEYLQNVECHLQNTKEPIERTSYLIEYFQEIVIQNPGLSRLLWDFTSLALWSDSFRELLDSLYKDLTNMIKDYILDNNSIKDEVKAYDSELFAKMILGAMLGVGVQILIDPDEKDLMASLDTIKIIFK